MCASFLTVLVEPNVLFREGLKQILHSRLRMLKTAAEMDESLSSLVSKQRRALLVLGPGVDVGRIAQQIAIFKKMTVVGRVVAMANHYEASEALAAFRAGANGYLVNISNCESFHKSLELVMLGETIVPAELIPSLDRERGAAFVHPDYRSIADPHPVLQVEGGPRLSQSETRILRRLVDGDSNKAIARKLGAAEATVKIHVKAILRKIRVSNRTQAAVWAMNIGLLDAQTDDEPTGGEAPHRELERASCAPLPAKLSRISTTV